MSQQTLPKTQLAELEPAFAALAKYDRGSGRATLLPLDEAVAAANFHVSSRAALEKRLLRTLKAAPPKPAREYICGKLAWIGSRASVSVLVGLLPDPELSAPARSALEAIGASAAAKAVRNAVPRLPERQKAGAVRSLGMMRDADSVRTIAPLLHAANPELVLAAVTALGNIGSAAAASELLKFAPKVPASLRAGYGDAALICAGRLAQAGLGKEAHQLREVLSGSEFPKHIREAAAGPVQA